MKKPHGHVALTPLPWFVCSFVWLGLTLVIQFCSSMCRVPGAKYA